MTIWRTYWLPLNVYTSLTWSTVTSNLATFYVTEKLKGKGKPQKGDKTQTGHSPIALMSSFGCKASENVDVCRVFFLCLPRDKRMGIMLGPEYTTQYM